MKEGLFLIFFPWRSFTQRDGTLGQRAIAPFGIHYKVMYTSTKVRDDSNT